jgi:predicted transcriptional regulator
LVSLQKEALRCELPLNIFGGLVMPCISADGKLTSEGRMRLERLKAVKAVSAEEIASVTGEPLFKVRRSMRELKTAGYVEENEGRYTVTEQGLKALNE